jgi:ABC-type Mn2+/Zn2+ transport system ATPase subunit
LALTSERPLLQACQLAYGYGQAPVLHNLDLAVARGSCTLIRGDNGAGKSTLLQLLQGKRQPSAGWVHLGGRPLSGQRLRLALVPQDSSVRWHYPIHLAALVALGCCSRGQGPAQALQQVGLADLAQTPIAALSGGQRQRALIARALARQAEVLLLDEPFAALDDQSSQQLGALLQALATGGTAVVLTAHGVLPTSLRPGRQLQLCDGQLHAWDR